MLFDEAGGPVPARNLVRLRLGKRDGVTFTLQAKTPGPHLDSQEVDIVGRLRRCARRPSRRLRTAARRRARRKPSPVRPPGRRRAHVAGRPACARRAGSGPSLRTWLVGAAGSGLDLRRGRERLVPGLEMSRPAPCAPLIIRAARAAGYGGAALGLGRRQGGPREQSTSPTPTFGGATRRGCAAVPRTCHRRHRTPPAGGGSADAQAAVRASVPD